MIWDSMLVGAFEGLGIAVVVWVLLQVRKLIYYHSRWKVWSAFNNADNTTRPWDKLVPTLAGQRFYWSVGEPNIGSGAGEWGYIPFPGEKPT